MPSYAVVKAYDIVGHIFNRSSNSFHTERGCQKEAVSLDDFQNLLSLKTIDDTSLKFANPK